MIYVGIAIFAIIIGIPAWDIFTDLIGKNEFLNRWRDDYNRAMRDIEKERRAGTIWEDLD